MVEFDDSQFPIVVARWTGETTLVDFEACLAWVEKHLASAREQKTRLALISIAETTKADPEMRRQLAERSKPLLVDEILSFVVINSMVVRGLFTAVAWLNPSLKNVRLVSSFDIALREAREGLKISA